ncbi:transposase [Pseudovibrio sp. Tun.PSC04-5.I4]|nr:transposase [Pseudovibrio sp. Tun.PSC04-5.I4]
MRLTTGIRNSPGEKIVKDIKRATHNPYSSAENFRIVLDGLRGEGSTAELCRCEGLHQGIYYKWLKGFMEAVSAGYSACCHIRRGQGSAPRNP